MAEDRFGYELYVLLERMSEAPRIIQANSGDGPNSELGESIGKFNKEYIQEQFMEHLQEVKDSPDKYSKLISGFEYKNIPQTEKQFDHIAPSVERGETLLHFALTLPLNEEADAYGYKEIRDKAIEEIFQTCPQMLVKQNVVGITPLQIAIAKQEQRLVKSMFKTMLKEMLKTKRNEFDVSQMSQMTANKVFDGTNMMAATPIGIAAVTFNKSIFKICVKAGVPIDSTNGYGDNVIHSLIRHSYRQTDPQVQKKVLEWFEYIDRGNWSKISEKREEIMQKQKGRVGGLWAMVNKEGLSPLVLAAKLGQFDLFKYIMNSEQFTIKKFDDGSVSNEEYNITSIDTIPPVVKLPNDQASNQATDTVPNNQNSNGGRDDVQEEKLRHISIFEYILMEEPSVAFKFISFPPIRGVIQAKWAWYKWIVLIWFFIHTAFICLYSWYSVQRSYQHVTPYENKTASTRGDPDFVINIQNHGLMAVGIAGGLLAIFYLTCLIASYWLRRFQVKPNKSRFKNTRDHLQKPYSNTAFKVLFIVFSVCLIFDCIFALSLPRRYEHFLTPFCLLIGYYLILFFLRTCKPFTMFTLLLQRLIFDLFEFAVIMMLLLVAFSFAMFVVMQGAATDDDSFHTFDRTLLKMLMVMLGIGDMDNLFDARYSQMAIFVFILFVFLTTILLLNALIATMSNTCTALMPQYGDVTTKQLHYRMQKLSMSIFLEGFLPPCMLKSVGEIESVRTHGTSKLIRMLRRSLIKEPEKSDDKPDIVMAYISTKYRSKRYARSLKVKPEVGLNRSAQDQTYGRTAPARLDPEIHEVPLTFHEDARTQTSE